MQLQLLLLASSACALLSPIHHVRPRHALRAADDAAALMEAAAKLRDEAKALEGEAQVEAAAFQAARAEEVKAAPKPITPAATIAAPTPKAAGLTASAFAGIAASREAFESTLSSLKEAGKASKWKSATLEADGAEQPTQARVRAATGIDGAKDLFYQEEVGNDQLFQVTAGVFLISSVLAIASGIIVGGNTGATMMYIFAVIPLAFLGVGSSSPGIIAALYVLVAGVKDQKAFADRRRRHESAHLVAGYKLGLSVAEYECGDKPRVEFYYATGRPYTRDEAEELACVALSGAIGECEAFGQAKGAQQDFADLQGIFDRVQPPLSPAEQQSATRRACLNAYGVLYGSKARKDDKVVRAVDDAMAAGAALPELICALENA
jgi:hypothetical protein